MKKKTTCKFVVMDNDLLLAIMEKIIPNTGTEAKENLTNMMSVNKRFFFLAKDADFVIHYKEL